MSLVHTFALGLAASIVLAGCGGDPSDSATGSGQGAGASGATSGAGPGSGPGSGSGSGSGGGSTAEWIPLITADWQLDPGSEKTSDVHLLTLDRDIYVGAIRPIAPVGTHHTVLADGDLGTTNILYASGVGTNPIEFPPGVGLKLSAGQTIALQLHLFNVSAEPLTGLSGIEVVEVDPADLEAEADLFLPGPTDFSIPPNQTYAHSGKCTLGAPQTVFAIFPHMHQLGSHFKSTFTIGGKEKVIHDGDYQFVHQAFIPFEPIAMGAGDSVTTECTWTNTTADTVTWGESSTTEMCFSILYRYPAQTDSGFCNQ